MGSYIPFALLCFISYDIVLLPLFIDLAISLIEYSLSNNILISNRSTRVKSPLFFIEFLFYLFYKSVLTHYGIGGAIRLQTGIYQGGRRLQRAFWENIGEATILST